VAFEKLLRGFASELEFLLHNGHSGSHVAKALAPVHKLFLMIELLSGNWWTGIVGISCSA
jgi:hypothetical protein